MLGLPTWTDFGETITVRHGSGPTSYDDERDGQATVLGIWVVIVSIMFGARFGMAVAANRLDGGLTRFQRFSFAVWLVGWTVGLRVGRHNPLGSVRLDR